MFNNLNDTKIVEASAEDLLAAIGDSADDSKNKGKESADNNEGGEGANGDDKTKGKSQKASSKSSEKGKPATKSVSALSKDDLTAALGEDDDDEPGEDDDTSKKTLKKTSKKEDTDDDDESIEDEDEDKKDDDEDEDKKEDEDEEGGELSVGNFIKARVEFLIKKGEWVDWEGREAIEEWDEDAFADMELQQRNYQRAELREQVLDEFGPIGREIAQYVANGGDADDLIDIFKEQKVVENLSIDTEEQQKEVVKKFATEFQKMKPGRVSKYIDSLVADKELEEVAKEAKEAMEKDLKEQAQQLKEDQETAKKNREKQVQTNLQKFATDVTNVINTRDDIDPAEKKELLQMLTKFDKKLKDNTPVNEFYFKLAEFRKNLPNYIDLVRFVMNPKKFIKSAENKGKTSEAEKAFNLIRTGNIKKKTKSVDVSNQGEKSGKKSSGFKLLL